MIWSFTFILTSVLLGVGLAMDAFSVSLCNGLNEPCMRIRKMCTVAGVFAVFQGIMPMAGWFCVHNLIRLFKIFEPMIPWISLILLSYIGGKLLYDGIKHQGCEECCSGLGMKELVIQGIATSIDALSVGFTIAHYNTLEAFVSSTWIASVTFVICLIGVRIGKTFGMKLANKASILGGIILIAIGIEIFVSGVI